MSAPRPVASNPQNTSPNRNSRKTASAMRAYGQALRAEQARMSGLRQEHDISASFAGLKGVNQRVAKKSISGSTPAVREAGSNALYITEKRYQQTRGSKKWPR
jgi:hypothetical protein